MSTKIIQPVKVRLCRQQSNFSPAESGPAIAKNTLAEAIGVLLEPE